MRSRGRPGLRSETAYSLMSMAKPVDRIFMRLGMLQTILNSATGQHGRLESWQNAQNQAIAVAKVMCGERSPYEIIPWFWSDQFEVNIQLVGAPSAWDSLCFRGDPKSLKFSSFYIKDGKIIAAATFNRRQRYPVCAAVDRERKNCEPAYAR